jgi:hypothetical protein
MRSALAQYMISRLHLPAVRALARAASRCDAPGSAGARAHPGGLISYTFFQPGPLLLFEFRGNGCRYRRNSQRPPTLFASCSRFIYGTCCYQLPTARPSPTAASPSQLLQSFYPHDTAHGYPHGRRCRSDRLCLRSFWHNPDLGNERRWQRFAPVTDMPRKARPGRRMHAHSLHFTLYSQPESYPGAGLFVVNLTAAS